MPRYYIDFETRSPVDLKTAGVANYVQHPDTSVLCMAYACGDEPIRIWWPGQPFPFTDHGANTYVAHNASFEWYVWNAVQHGRHRWPTLLFSQMDDTMTRAYAMALPGSLDHAAAAVGIPAQKDMIGHRLMMQMCRPRADGTYWEEPDQLARLGEYCKQDVAVERDLDERLMPLSPYERRIVALDRLINSRGVMVDLPAITVAIELAKTELDRIGHDLSKLTNGKVNYPTQVAALSRWLASEYDIAPDSLDGGSINELLAQDIPDDVRQALLLRQEGSRTSVAKFTAMRDAAGSDGRVRDTLQYHAAGTGRWGGRRIQTQNMARWPKDFKIADAEYALSILKSSCTPQQKLDRLRMFYGSPLSVLSWLTRAVIMAAPGHELLAADYSNIEGRGLPWLAGEQWKLDAFQECNASGGPDIYERTYSKAFGIDPAAVNSEQRQLGKIMELAFGFGGGKGAFAKMAHLYGVSLPETEVQALVDAWRKAHPKIVDFWFELNAAAKWAVLHAGRKYAAGAPGREVVFRTKGSFLWCRLPSGRLLCYPYPRLAQRETPWRELREAVHYKAVDDVSRKWKETSTYGGKLSENVTQAMCRDVLAHSIVRCEESGIPLVMHVHDELVAEVPCGALALPRYAALCSEAPAWAAGLPVVAKGWVGERYRKA